jgi:hypothetical protein
MAEPQIELNDSRRGQLRAFLEEQDAIEDRVKLQPVQTLPENYNEAVLLDEASQPTSTKRILFP